MTQPSVIFVDDEEHLRRAAAQTFELADIACDTFDRADEVMSLITRTFTGILVTDIRMPDVEGTELMRRVLEIDPELPVVLITGHGDVELAVECIKNGAYDFIEKPFDPQRLVDTVRRALEKRRLVLENRALRHHASGDDAIDQRLTGRSAVIDTVRTQLRAIAQTDVDILIHGETGTGKDLASRALHEASARADGPFVHVNCATLPEAMIETELFGHVAGAFPGALRDRFGKFEHAHRGILCLDEIDSLPMPLQAKLLQALQSREITRVGSNDPVPLDFRTIAIAKTDLTQAVEAGAFRADLLYRLNVVTLRMPCLSERREDIPLLFAELLNDASTRYKGDAPRPDPVFLQSLGGRDWHGNVRELRNTADRHYLGLDDGPQAAAVSASASLAEQMAEFEKGLIVAAISSNGGSIKATCESLNVPRKTLYDKMRKLGIDRASIV